MKREHVVTGIVGTLVGFILGYFVALGLQRVEGVAEIAPSASELPENHPSPEQMQQLRELLELVQVNPDDRESRVKLGNSFYDMGRFDAAIQWYEEALALDASDVQVSTDLGTSYLYTGEFDKAIDQYRKSLQLEADHAQTLQNMGIAFFSRGDYAEAIDVWQKLVDTHPGYPKAEEIRDQISTAKLHLKKESSSQ